MTDNIRERARRRVAWATVAITASCLVALPAISAGRVRSRSLPSRCVSSRLAVSVAVEEGATGKRFWILAFRNTGGNPCHLYGYPGVGLLDSNSRLLPFKVSRAAGSEHAITLRAGGRAWFTLEFENGGFCPGHASSFSGLRVYPPDSRGFLTIKHFKHGSESACIPPNYQVQVTPVRATVFGSAEASAGPARCTTGGLDMWLTQQEGAAGSFFFTIALENMTRHKCSLFGYPGVSAVSLTGQQIGAPAGRETSEPARSMTLAPEGQVVTIVHVTDVFLLPPSCHQTLAAGFRVYPPGNTASRIAWAPVHVCANRAEQHMLVRSVKPQPTQ